MHNCIHYLGYPLPALIYDARRGSALSAYAVYYYFINSAKNGGDPGSEVRQFVAQQLEAALEGKQSPRDMIHKNPGKRLQDYSEIYDRVSWARSNGMTLEMAGETAAVELGDSTFNVLKQYKIMQRRMKRIMRVQDLLDAMKATQDGETAQSCVDELNDIYSKPLKH